MSDYDQCRDCGMKLFLHEYHPYPACVMYRQVRDSDKVRGYLDQIRADGAKEAEKELAAMTAERDYWFHMSVRWLGDRAMLQKE